MSFYDVYDEEKLEKSSFIPFNTSKGVAKVDVRKKIYIKKWRNINMIFGSHIVAEIGMSSESVEKSKGTVGSLRLSWWSSLLQQSRLGGPTCSFACHCDR